MQFIPLLKALPKTISIATSAYTAIPWEKLPKIPFINNKDTTIPKKYKHFKGGIYTVLIEGVLDEKNLENILTIYQGIDGAIWARNSAEFHGYKDDIKRFELIKE